MHNKDKNSHSGPHAGQPLREKVHIWPGSLHAANFIYYICDDSLFVNQKILCVHVFKKVKTILHFFSHSPTIIDEKYFRWKWMHFRKIYQGRLSFFWSWWHFMNTGWLTKILEGTLHDRDRSAAERRPRPACLIGRDACDQFSSPKATLHIFSTLVFMAVSNTSSSYLHLKHGALRSRYMSLGMRGSFSIWKILDVALSSQGFQWCC